MGKKITKWKRTRSDGKCLEVAPVSARHSRRSQEACVTGMAKKSRLSVQVPLSKSEFHRKPAESPEQSGCLSGSSPAVLSIVCAGSWWGQGDLMMTPLQQLQESWGRGAEMLPRGRTLLSSSSYQGLLSG